MTKSPRMKRYYRVLSQRSKLLRRVRNLARSGRYPDHCSILAELEHLEAFAAVRACLRESPIPAQLDRLCAMARAGGRAIRLGPD